jgi:hypothetical protein
MLRGGRKPVVRGAAGACRAELVEADVTERLAGGAVAVPSPDQSSVSLTFFTVTSSSTRRSFAGMSRIRARRRRSSTSRMAWSPRSAATVTSLGKICRAQSRSMPQRWLRVNGFEPQYWMNAVVAAARGESRLPCPSLGHQSILVRSSCVPAGLRQVMVNASFKPDQPRRRLVGRFRVRPPTVTLARSGL